MSGPRVLVVDDQPANVRLLERILKSNGYSEVLTTTESPEIPEIYRTHKPDLILLDLHMPVMDGFEVLERLQAMTVGEVYLPIVVLTADITPEARRRALAAGAKDFLIKPFDAAEVLLRIHNLLETRRLHQRLSDRNRDLEIRVSERTEQLESARLEILERSPSQPSSGTTTPVSTSTGSPTARLSSPEAWVCDPRRWS